MCFPRAAKWKRERFENQKFDYIDVDEYYKGSIITRTSYGVLYLMALKAVLTYTIDATIVTLMIYNQVVGIKENSIFSNFNDDKDGLIHLPPFLSVISFSDLRFLLILFTFTLSVILLMMEWKRAIRIVNSRDIGCIFTSPLAYRIVSLKSYAHYCFFGEVQNSKKLIDILSFYVFFSFTNWKRLLLAEFPRASINFLVLVNVLYKAYMRDPNRTPLSQNVIDKCGLNLICSTSTILDGSINYLAYASGRSPDKDLFQIVQIILIAFVTIIWTFSAIRLIISMLLYLPLLCVIRGDLREYCCHKVDKRIDELVRRTTIKRIREAKEESYYDGSGKYGKGSKIKPALPHVYGDSNDGINTNIPPCGSNNQRNTDVSHTSASSGGYGNRYPSGHPYATKGNSRGDSSVLYSTYEKTIKDFPNIQKQLHFTNTDSSVVNNWKGIPLPKVSSDPSSKSRRDISNKSTLSPQNDDESASSNYPKNATYLTLHNDLKDRQPPEDGCYITTLLDSRSTFCDDQANYPDNNKSHKMPERTSSLIGAYEDTGSSDGGRYLEGYSNFDGTPQLRLNVEKPAKIAAGSSDSISSPRVSASNNGSALESHNQPSLFFLKNQKFPDDRNYRGLGSYTTNIYSTPNIDSYRYDNFQYGSDSLVRKDSSPSID